ncbi:helix-turn-helix domain-containing protein [Rhodococcus rhodochrous]|uniref:helix-turn-helix domain-containing protein n=1 Tax=Rhodococcus rhodochrous TaxID=1829 RepID=UPI0017836F0B|nr:helix-turn-helix transcriptional regulator [Rhodococcus rhodochrous]QOH59864.1 hypothetical protein C6Y44_27625 [Rhodococcus rhodochrous]
MARSNVPEPWASAMEAVGAVSPQTGLPSLNALGQRAGVHTTTVSNLVQGKTQAPDLDTVTKLARALRKPVRVVAAWVGINWVENRPYTPPKEADLLDASERELVDNLIRSLARQKTGLTPQEAEEASTGGRQAQLFSHK